jgi:hypothetical protein
MLNLLYFRRVDSPPNAYGGAILAASTQTPPRKRKLGQPTVCHMLTYVRSKTATGTGWPNTQDGALINTGASSDIFSTYLYSCCSPLEQRASVKRFVSLQFPRQSVGLLGREISPSKGRYITQDNTDTEHTHTNIHALSGIRTHNPSLQASEDISCLRPRGHRERPSYGSSRHKNSPALRISGLTTALN